MSPESDGPSKIEGPSRAAGPAGPLVTPLKKNIDSLVNRVREILFPSLKVFFFSLQGAEGDIERLPFDPPGVDNDSSSF